MIKEIIRKITDIKGADTSNKIPIQKEEYPILMALKFNKLNNLEWFFELIIFLRYKTNYFIIL